MNWQNSRASYSSPKLCNTDMQVVNLRLRQLHLCWYHTLEKYHIIATCQELPPQQLLLFACSQQPPQSQHQQPRSQQNSRQQQQHSSHGQGAIHWSETEHFRGPFYDIQTEHSRRPFHEAASEHATAPSCALLHHHWLWGSRRTIGSRGEEK